MIVLATQGSQGVVALRELFGLGITPNQISVLVCQSGFNKPLWEFLIFNQMKGVEITSGRNFDEWLDVSDVSPNAILLSVSWKYKFSKNAVLRFGNKGINLHPGLLPEYKGCFSTPWAIINGEDVTGYTYHVINDEFDGGGILLREELRINPNDTAHSLNYRVMQRALSRMGDVLLIAGSAGSRQCGDGNYYKNEIPFNGQIQANWDQKMRERFIRAMFFPPYDPAFELCNGEKIFLTPELNK